MSQDDYCVICYEPGEFVKSQPCECKGTLQFHSKCLDELKKHTHVCPTCKTEFKLPDGPAVLKMGLYETMHVTIKNGKWHGPAHLFDEEFRTREFTEFYEHGLSTGRMNLYHENGRIDLAETVIDYRKIGPYMKYHKDGSVKEMGYYKDQRLLYAYRYAKDGTIIAYRRKREGEKGFVYWISPSLRLKYAIKEMNHRLNVIKYNLDDVFDSIKNYFGFA